VSTHPSEHQSGLRIAAPVLLVLALALVAFFVTRGGSHTYRFAFENAGQLVKGDVVRIGGTPVGTVRHIGLTPDGQALVTVSLDDSHAPLHAGTTATVRQQGLVSVAGRYVDITPGPNFRAPLADRAEISRDNTTSIVEIDQLFNTLDGGTRKGLSRVIHGFGDWYTGRAAEANTSARYFPPALSAATRLFNELNADNGQLRAFVDQTGRALADVSANRGALTDWVSNARTTAHALSVNDAALSQALANLPPALRRGSDALAALRPALGDLQRLVDASGPASRQLEPFFRTLRPVVSKSVPVFSDLSAMFDAPGPSNDLYDALVDLPALARLTDTTFPRAEKALADSTPVLGFARPYVPDLVSWARSFGGATATYDANGHYARTVPVFDAFGFQGDSNGGHLDPKAPADRGQSSYLQTGQLKRCPGASMPALADGSAPFVDSGALANPDCDPAQRPGG
jgi:phospholipid/cholesterol/gamma-HCH transport system substrate-binding protein